MVDENVGGRDDCCDICRNRYFDFALSFLHCLANFQFKQPLAHISILSLLIDIVRKACSNYYKSAVL